jgi:lycopene cyclase domain-containing protein
VARRAEDAVTYLDVQILLIPFACAAAAHLPRRRGVDLSHWWLGIAVLCVVASVWTTPWDNWMVATGVWGYPPEAVLATIGFIPAEEQAFFVYQTCMTGAFLGVLINPRAPLAARNLAFRVSVTSVVLFFMLLGYFFYQSGCTYLGSMLMWFGLPLALQCAWGADQLVTHLRAIVPAIAIPSSLLCYVDTLAVGSGTWYFDASALTGIHVGSLPIEEVVFFVLTNTLIVVGLTLWHELKRDTRPAGIGPVCLPLNS